MFSQEQRKAIEEKVELLRELKEGKISYKQLEKKIIDARLAWFEENKDKLIEEINSQRFRTDSDLEKVHYLIFHQWLRDRLCRPEDNSSILSWGGRL